MSGKRVLIIDDETNMRHMLQVMLNKAGYTAETAADGNWPHPRQCSHRARH